MNSSITSERAAKEGRYFLQSFTGQVASLADLHALPFANFAGPNKYGLLSRGHVSISGLFTCARLLQFSFTLELRLAIRRTHYSHGLGLYTFVYTIRMLEWAVDPQVSRCRSHTSIPALPLDTFRLLHTLPTLHQPGFPLRGLAGRCSRSRVQALVTVVSARSLSPSLPCRSVPSRQHRLVADDPRLRMGNWAIFVGLRKRVLSYSSSNDPRDRPVVFM